MKRIVFFIAVLFLVSCGSKKTNEDINKEITEYKNQIVEINKKIKALEEEIVPEDGQLQRSIPVTVKEMEASTFHHYIEVNGTVEAVNSAYVSPEINGQVEAIYVKEGERVKTGQKLFKLNDIIVENSIKEVETALSLATIVYEKQKRLYDKQIGSEIDYLTAKNNKESLESKLKTLNSQLDMAEVKAYFDGIIDDILIEVGEMAMPGMMAMQLVNLDELYVNADVSEAYLTKVKKGDLVMLEFPSYPGMKMEVSVHRTGNIVKSANRTFKVQLKVSNNNELIKPNVIALIKINDYTASNAISVPSIIIKEDMQGPYLYVVNQESATSARKVYVKTGKSYGSMTMITDGLAAGDKVIVEGYNLVSDGMIVNVRG
jgi:RND family efflux transporter MFP subunit